MMCAALWLLANGLSSSTIHASQEGQGMDARREESRQSAAMRRKSMPRPRAICREGDIAQFPVAEERPADQEDGRCGLGSHNRNVPVQVNVRA
jgi:hypothetical protein